MNKKNGFTLVELLGVIVILAILALITIPIISNVINDVRIKSLQNSAYGLIEASNLYYAQYGVNSNTRFDIDNNQISSTDTTNLLKYKGSVKEGTVILDKKGQVTVCITDGKNSAYKNYNESKVTAIKGKVCNIPTNISIVYLGDDATIEAYDDVKLTELVNELIEKNNTLESKVEVLENNSTSIDEIYPIGSVYTSFEDDTVSKVESRFGGTWEQLDSGYMLQSTSTTSNQKGGSTTATFTPSGTVGDTTLSVDQMPSHDHKINGKNYLMGNYGHYGAGDYYRPISSNVSGTSGYYMVQFSGYIETTGSSQPHTHSFTGTSQTINTVSPYITVYMYKRTA